MTYQMACSQNTNGIMGDNWDIMKASKSAIWNRIYLNCGKQKGRLP